MFPVPRGVRKASELVTQRGRSLIFTEENADKLDWSEIPNGALKINPKTGLMSVKLDDLLIMNDGTILENSMIYDGMVYTIIDNLVDNSKGHGLKPAYKPKEKPGDPDVQYSESEVSYSSQTNWIPAGLKNDGTICIAKDTIIVEENFTITKVDKVKREVTYTNQLGQNRHFPMTKEGYFVFELEQGTYAPERNHLEVIIDDCLRRSANSGGIIELNEWRFACTEDLKEGQEICARYEKIMRVGNPYPRIFLSKDEPLDSEMGDLWHDLDDFIDTDLGVFIDKTILSDEPLDAGLQPKEGHIPPNDLEPDEAKPKPDPVRTKTRKHQILILQPGTTSSVKIDNPIRKNVVVVYEDPTDKRKYSVYGICEIGYLSNYIQLTSSYTKPLNLEIIYDEVPITSTPQPRKKQNITLPAGKSVDVTITDPKNKNVLVMYDSSASGMMYRADGLCDIGFFDNKIRVTSASSKTMQLEISYDDIPVGKTTAPRASQNITLPSGASRSIPITDPLNKNVAVMYADKTGAMHTVDGICEIGYTNTEVRISNVYSKALNLEISYNA